LLVNKVIVLGGGSAGFLSALALKRTNPELSVTVIRSKDIGVIGVGEGSTFAFSGFLHQYLKLPPKRFHLEAQPTWKLGLRFIWGDRPNFNYTFGPGIHGKHEPRLPKALGFYCDEPDGMDYCDLYSALMTEARVFPLQADGKISFNILAAYHIENERFVGFLETVAREMGITVLDDMVRDVQQNEAGVSGLVLKSGPTMSADLYVDCSGFVSALLGKTLKEPFISYKSTLQNRRAVIGGWPLRENETILPYTKCETMNAGWCWQIDHNDRVNRGYVYCPDFISDEEAEREFRACNPRVSDTRIINFISGRYERTWVKNVVAIGNSAGFVEPLEATALAMIGQESIALAETISDAERMVKPMQIKMYNLAIAKGWDIIRRFLSIHYKFNRNRDTPYWRYCSEHTDLSGAEQIIEFYQENGPTPLFANRVLGEVDDQFTMGGYVALLLGQRVPYKKSRQPTEQELAIVKARRERNYHYAHNGLTANQAVAMIRSPNWDWEANPLNSGTSGSVRIS
jgi:tryptophan halogenase